MVFSFYSLLIYPLVIKAKNERKVYGSDPSTTFPLPFPLLLCSALQTQFSFPVFFSLLSSSIIIRNSLYFWILLKKWRDTSRWESDSCFEIWPPAFPAKAMRQNVLNSALRVPSHLVKSQTSILSRMADINVGSESRAPSEGSPNEWFSRSVSWSLVGDGMSHSNKKRFFLSD